MILVVYSAVVVSAFRATGTPVHGKMFDNLFFLLTIVGLGFAILRACVEEGRSRARWLGFVLFAILHIPYGWPNAGGPALESPWRPRFPHTRVVQNLLMSLGILDDSTSDTIEKSNQRWHVLQSALVLPTGLIGMLLGDLLAARAERRGGRPKTAAGLGTRIGLGVYLLIYARVGVVAYRQAVDPVNHGRLLDNSDFLLTVGSFTVAALVGSIAHGRTRATWLGFAIFGWLHVEFGWPNATLNFMGTPWCAEFVHVPLIYDSLGDEVAPLTKITPMFRWHIIQSTLAMVAALMGAGLARWLPISSSQVNAARAISHRA
jgi:hypothetical protein